MYVHTYMKIQVPSMLAKGVETIEQTSSHNGLENS